MAQRHGDSRLSNGHLLLAQTPDWDVAPAGVGRWARRAHIAELLARQRLLSASDLREQPGHVWLSQGLPERWVCCVSAKSTVPRPVPH